MNYRSALERIFNSLAPRGIKLGLDNALWLNKKLNHPEDTFLSIHVAGTNGKGSVCNKIAAALQHAGYRTGLYTSPHLMTFRERIRVNGEMIQESELCEIMEEIFQISETGGLSPTFFELTTALAFHYFRKKNVEIAVIETGLGGRLDATNTITPILSIITSISLDHTELLGNSLEEIAEEKAGIIKGKVPVLVGPRVSHEIIKKNADLKKAPLISVSSTFETYEEENQAIAAAALKLISKAFPMTQENIDEGLKAKPACRMEIIDDTLILDVAHNPDGMIELFKSINKRYPGKMIDCLSGFSTGKDITSCLQTIHKNAGHLHLVSAAHKRAEKLSILKQKAMDAGLPSTYISTYSSVKEGMQSALQQVKTNNRLLVVCGSFFIMREVRAALQISEPADPIDLN